MSNQSDSRHTPTAFEWLCVLLTVLFAGLKLCGVIDWSWWWVFGPVWIPLAITLAIILGGAGFFGLVMLFTIGVDRWEKLKRRK